MAPVSVLHASNIHAITSSHGSISHASMFESIKHQLPDPAAQKVLVALSASQIAAADELTPQQARLLPTVAQAINDVLTTENKLSLVDNNLSINAILIDDGSTTIPAFIYTPEGEGPFPVILYYHGGGFVMCNSKAYESSIRALAIGAHSIVVAIDYHKAPEHPFPAAVDDAFTAYQWVLKHAKDLNGDPERIAVSGEGAGGNLAAVVSLMARDQKVKLPIHQVLIYPIVNDDFESPSYQHNQHAKPLNRNLMKWFFNHYDGDSNSPYVLPLKASSLRGLPAATIIAAEIDPLLFEGKAYADRLRFEGVDVAYRVYSGVTHEFFGMDAIIPKAKEAQLFAIENLLNAFSK